MPQLDPATALFASQIFWLIICFFTMMFIMSTFIIPKIAETRQQRQNKIDGYLQRADKLRQQTEDAIKKYEDALSDATQKANSSLQTTKDELNRIIADKQSELDKKLEAQIKAGEAEINAGKVAALKEIKTVSAELATEILRKLSIDGIKPADIKTIIEHEAE